MVPTLKDWLALGAGWAYSSQGGNAMQRPRDKGMLGVLEQHQESEYRLGKGRMEEEDGRKT